MKTVVDQNLRKGASWDLENLFAVAKTVKKGSSKERLSGTEEEGQEWARFSERHNKGGLRCSDFDLWQSH